MPKTYSVDLREKAMQFYKESKHKSKTCELFHIARTTLDDWILLEQQTGQLKQPKSPNAGHPLLRLKIWSHYLNNISVIQLGIMSF